MDVYDEIIKVLRAKGITEKLTRETEFQKISLDSLDLMDMVVNLEIDYGFTIPDESLFKIKTIGDLEEIIKELQG